MRTVARGWLVALAFPVFVCWSWTSKYISKDFEASSAAAYGKVVDPRAEVSSIAVFLLGTMYGAKEYGADTNEHAFYERAVAARVTWAKHAKVFYIVTGRGGSEDKALKTSTRCRDTTKHFREFLGRHHVHPQSFEVFHCGEPSLGMNVLHLPHCEGTYWGPKGPCCRCEAAALFYLALHSHHKINHNTTAFPNWFLFADDDFYVRLNYLDAMLTKPQFPVDHPYAVTSSCNFDSYQTNINGSSVKTERQNYGLFRHGGGNCTVPCAHRSAWMGFAVFSVGALRVFEKGLAEGGLVRVCQRWDVTHDIGVGLYAWMHSIATIDAPMANYGGPKTDADYNKEAVHWHKPFDKGLTYDELFELVVGDGDRSRKEPFNLSKYLDKERDFGLKHRTVAFPNGLIKNTLFFRKVQLYQAVKSQIEETQRPPGLGIEMTDYTPAQCTEDKMMFDAWEATQEEWKGKVRDNHGVKENQMKQCLQYTQYISNLPMNASLADLPPMDGLLRVR